jgi:Tol biopolymer transport system component/putative hemolysin
MIHKRLFILFMLIDIAFFSSCGPIQSTPTPQANMPNPASVYCEQNGGKLDFRQDASGGVAGICVLPDGSECDEWAYFRGECKPGDSLVKPVSSEIPSPSSPDATVPPLGDGRGQIVFYSDRDGGYNNVYILEIGSLTLSRLTQGQSNTFSGPFSPDGTRLLFTGFGLTHSYIGVMNEDGSGQTDLTNRPNSDDAFPVWSPDGKHIAFTSRRDGNNEIYVMNADGSDPKRLTNNPKDDFAPAWSPDGSQIAFVSDRDNQTGIYSLYVMSADGTAVIRLTKDKSNDYSPDWSPDGTKIADHSIREGQADIYVINVDSSGETNLTNTPADDYAPRWSPDGNQIAFQTKRDGNWEIYLMDVDGSNLINLTNNVADDQLPYWKP